jgi:hypothetical protein
MAPMGSDFGFGQTGCGARPTASEIPKATDEWHNLPSDRVLRINMPLMNISSSLLRALMHWVIQHLHLSALMLIITFNKTNFIWNLMTEAAEKTFKNCNAALSTA